MTRVTAQPTHQHPRERPVAVFDSGVGGLTVSMPANGHVPGAVTLAGQTLTKLLAR